ncbi:MAG TPA: LPS export ABC transporter periplasmic protein LptC [Rhizobiales bacterium]|nr:lipopolysaccharide-assembly, LptC-related [bacterium BMS3Bbin10]HDO51927.1 LPS export ABC transporter periplasmic protein LptC [Hyphomicrobiales bacterium]
MTTEAQHPFTRQGREFPAAPGAGEWTKLMARARAHSRLVARLRIALPVLAVAVAGLYFVSPKIQMTFGDLNASVAGVVIEKGRLRMVNPKLEGVNDEQGAYVVTADYAEQVVANPDIIYLTEIRAEMNNNQKGWSRLSAPKGVFETKTEKLELAGDIRTVQSGGMTARLSRASIDMKKQLIVSNEPVDVDFLNGTVRSDAMTIHTGEKRVIFRNNVRVHIRKRPEKKAVANQ